MEYNQNEIKEIFNIANDLFPKGLTGGKSVVRIIFPEGEYSVMMQDYRQSFKIGVFLNNCFWPLVKVTKEKDSYSLSFYSEFSAYIYLNSNSDEEILKFFNFLKYQRFGKFYLNVNGNTINTSKARFKNSIDPYDFEDDKDLLDFIRENKKEQEYVRGIEQWIDKEYKTPGHVGSLYSLPSLLSIVFESKRIDGGGNISISEEYKDIVINDLKEAFSQVIVIQSENFQQYEREDIYIVARGDISPILMSGSQIMKPSVVAYLENEGITPSACISIRLYPEVFNIISKTCTEEVYNF